MMVKRNQGLIVNISSYGGVRYLFNVPYGVGKVKLNQEKVFFKPSFFFLFFSNFLLKGCV